MFKLIVPDTTAIQIAPWFQTNGGIKVWSSLDLSQPERQWLTSLDGEKPHYAADPTPEEITDPKDVGVVVLEEVDRFPVELRVSGNGLGIKLQDESNDRLNERVRAGGKHCTYQFDYDTQEAVILDTTAEAWGLDIFVDVGDKIGLPLE